MDNEGTPILWVRRFFPRFNNKAKPTHQLRRPFSWINSRMFVQRTKHSSDPTFAEDEPILDTFSEVQQRWHLWRRRYDLFIRQGPKRILSLVSDPQPEPETESYHQMAKIDEPFLAWNFSLWDARGKEMGNVSRAFRGLGREVRNEHKPYFWFSSPSP